MTNNAPVASFTFRTILGESYHDESYSVVPSNGRLMILRGDQLVTLDSFLARNDSALTRILRRFRDRPHMLDGTEIRITNRMRHGRYIVSILGGPLHGRQF